MLKIKLLKGIALLGLALISISAFATSTEPSRSINRIFTYDAGVLIEFTSSGNNAENCTPSRDKFAFLDTNATGGKQMLASVLAAHVSNKPLSVGISGCVDWGASTISKVYRVDF